MKELKTVRTITDRSNPCVVSYLHDINMYSRLSPEEEAELCRLVKKGGRTGAKAKERLIQGNLRFVISVANQCKTSKMELADLISEGNIGLVKAAELFDETRGFKFISYAVWWIRQSIMNAIENTCTTLRLPSNQQKLLRKYNDLDKVMMQQEQRHLTIDEFCDIEGIEPSRMATILSATYAPVKMDAPVADDSDTAISDTISSDYITDSILERESLSTDINEAIGSYLTKREQEIVCSFYGIGRPARSMEDIALSLGLTRERTRQICLRAQERLRTCPYASQLALYLAA